MNHSNNPPLKNMPGNKPTKVPLTPFLISLFIANTANAAEIASEKPRSFPNFLQNHPELQSRDALTLDNDLTNYYLINCGEKPLTSKEVKIEHEAAPSSKIMKMEHDVDPLLITKKAIIEAEIELSNIQTAQARKNCIAEIEALSADERFQTQLEIISEEEELTDDDILRMLQRDEANRAQGRELSMLSYLEKVKKEEIIEKAGKVTRETIPPILGGALGTGVGFGGMAAITAAGFSIPFFAPVIAGGVIGVITWGSLRVFAPQFFEKIPKKTIRLVEKIFNQGDPITQEDLINDFHLIINENQQEDRFGDQHSKTMKS